MNTIQQTILLTITMITMIMIRMAIMIMMRMMVMVAIITNTTMRWGIITKTCKFLPKKVIDK